MSFEVVVDNHEEIISDDSNEIDLNLGNNSARVTSSVQVQQEKVPDVREANEAIHANEGNKANDNNHANEANQMNEVNHLKDDSNEVNIVEPYVGQEFDSEEAAHSFYTAYAMRMGFIVRMDCLRRSRDGTIIKRTFVCNKEGYRRITRSDKNSKRPRKPFRMGCKAKLSLRRLVTGIWVVTKFVREHAHPLPGAYPLPGTVRQSQNEHRIDPTSNESTKIKELTKQLLRERKRSASFRKIIDLLFSHIKEHTEELSRKIQCIADKVNEIDSMDKTHQENVR